MTDVKLGVLLWPQYTDWQSLSDAAARADELGFDSLWTWDHLYPIVGDWQGPIFEGYTTLAAWAGVTKHATLGLMVGANTFRNPALVVKEATTLDHISGGRAVLGIGGAWFETEHEGYGIDFGRSAGERLDWLDEAVELMRGMLDAEEASARGDRYHASHVRNDPRPVQQHLPILIGGSGEKKTLKTVAKYADAWNTGGTLDEVRHKDEVLRRWCDEVGRDESQIERTMGYGSLIIRDDHADGERLAAEINQRNGNSDAIELVTTSAELVEQLSPYLSIGFRHIYFDIPAPFDAETIERLAKEVKSRLSEVS